MNTRSVTHKINDINIFFASLSKTPDVFAISESWLTDSTMNSANIDGFSSYHVPRPPGHEHGGVSCYVRESFDSELVENLSFVNNLIEICTVKVKVKEEIFIISSVYRPSNKHIDVDNFDKYLSNLLKSDFLKKNRHILLGDFNINLLEMSSHSHTNHFINSMQNFKYIPLISRPTRFPDGNQRGDPSLLDHIYINFAPPLISGIFEHVLTDHRPIFINISLPQGTTKHRKIKFRLLNNNNRQMFTRALCNVHWEEILNLDDFNSNFNIFFNRFSELYNKYFPIMTKVVNEKQILNPWITPTLIRSIKNRNNLYKSQKNGTVSEAFYKNYCYNLTKLIKRTKRNYYFNVFSDFKRNIKKTWETLNKLTGKASTKTIINNIIYKDKALDSPKDISEAFNDFFINVAVKLESKLPPPFSDPSSYLQGNFPVSMEIPVVNIQHIINIIKSLPNKRANIYDFSPIIIKENSLLIVHPLRLLFNQSIEKGQFPDVLKVARITPLYKKGPKHDINNRVD